jgi:RimJ/RimL family protein N-acetyltransferase
MPRSKVTITELERDDLPFLLQLWHDPEVMRYADEFPRYRGWSRSDEPDVAWTTYQERRACHGAAYTQLILRLDDGMPIGESFLLPLPEGATFGKWQKPDGTMCLLGDIKLSPAYWGRRLGTAGMRKVVRFAFTNTLCELFVVPPHRKNPAAYRVYEKVGFMPFSGMRSWRNHKVMKLSRERYRRLYQGVTAYG